VLDPLASGIRMAGWTEVPRLAEVMAAAFHEDPVFEWLMPADLRRHVGSRHFFDLELRTVGLARGQVWTTDQLDGAALSIPPGMWRLPWPVAIRHGLGFTRAFGARLPHATALLLMMERRHISEPHHYFPYIGVAPAAQGRGLGTRLMQPTLDRCDEVGLPAYLEATSERNAKLYERLGFTVIEELTFASSPPLILMRHPESKWSARID